MKTRIRIVEYGDGRKEYFPEVRYGFKKFFVSAFESEPFWFIVAFVLVVPFAYLLSFDWYKIEYEQETPSGLHRYRANKFKDMETAKKAVDNFILIHETDKAQKAAEKLSKKKVKTEYLDYP